MKILKILSLVVFIFLLFGCVSPHNTSIELQRKTYGPWEKETGYVQVVQVGKTLYLSGVVSQGKTMAEQVNGVYQSIQSILKDYKTDTSRIVKEVVYTKNIEELKKHIALRKSYFPNEQYPTSTWVEIERLYFDEFLVEVEVVVLLP